VKNADIQHQYKKIKTPRGTDAPETKVKPMRWDDNVSYQFVHQYYLGKHIFCVKNYHKFHF